MKNFWRELIIPFKVLAPMEGVTDFVFRQIIEETGKPDVFFTEFTSCDGLVSKGRKKLEENLKFEKNEKPIVAQVWGINPENFYKAAKHIKKLGFSGIDINMGCPDKAVVKKGGGAALVKNQALAGEIIRAVKEGLDGALPVSVKTRIGFEKEEVDEWIGFLLKQDLDALTIHLRTFEELSRVEAHWNLMPRIMDLRKKYSPKTLIIGNGDIKSLEEIEEKFKLYGCDGFMVGTGVLGNPWIFNKSVDHRNVKTEDRFKLYLKHIELYSKTWGKSRNSDVLKKFCKTYINNFPEASLIREKIMETKGLKELEEAVGSYTKS